MKTRSDYSSLESTCSLCSVCDRKEEESPILAEWLGDFQSFAMIVDSKYEGSSYVDKLRKTFEVEQRSPVIMKDVRCKSVIDYESSAATCWVWTRFVSFGFSNFLIIGESSLHNFLGGSNVDKVSNGTIMKHPSKGRMLFFESDLHIEEDSVTKFLRGIND